MYDKIIVYYIFKINIMTESFILSESTEETNTLSEIQEHAQHIIDSNDQLQWHVKAEWFTKESDWIITYISSTWDTSFSIITVMILLYQQDTNNSWDGLVGNDIKELQQARTQIIKSMEWKDLPIWKTIILSEDQTTEILWLSIEWIPISKY